MIQDRCILLSRGQRIPLLLLACVAGLTLHLSRVGAETAADQSPREVRWDAPTNPWPTVVWVYDVVPNVFPAWVVSNALAMTGYTTNDVTTRNTNGMIFSNPRKPGSLGISYPLGLVEYWTSIPFGLTNLATAVPEEKQLYRLTTNFLSQVGVHVDELVKEPNSSQPLIHYLEDQVVFTSTNSAITNIWSREAHFHRLLEGVEFIGSDRGGDGVIEFGDHATILRFNLSWWNLKRDKAFSTVTPRTIMRWIREGKVLPQNIPGLDSPPINGWSGIKAVTVKRARLVCMGEPGSPILRPHAAVEAIVDTGTTNFPVGIDCPVIDETKPVATKSPK
jgi:hypothetical protein